jgi:hypothetical protein
VTGIEGSNETNEFADVREMVRLVNYHSQTAGKPSLSWLVSSSSTKTCDSLQRGILLMDKSRFGESDDDGENCSNNAGMARLLTSDLAASDAVERNFVFFCLDGQR